MSAPDDAKEARKNVHILSTFRSRERILGQENIRSFVDFGIWDHPDEALEVYLSQQGRLYLGETAERKADVTVKYLCDCILTAKQRHVENGELAQRSFNDILKTCKRIAKFFGRSLWADDFRPAAA